MREPRERGESPREQRGLHQPVKNRCSEGQNQRRKEDSLARNVQ